MFAPLFQRLRSFADSNGERLSKIAIGFTGLATAGMLVFHFTMTLLYVEPANPFRDQVQSFVDGYMAPYFVQNWHLFAPLPEEPSKHLGVVCRFAEPGVPDTDVIDVTAPHYEHFQRYRVSASQRIIRSQVYPLMFVHPEKDGVTLKLEKLGEDGTEEERAVFQAVEASTEETHKAGLRLLSRVASAECERRFPDAQLSEVHVLYYQEHAPKFSQRNDPQAKGQVTNMDYGWHPYEKVASY
jgi:hypothetical protein